MPDTQPINVDVSGVKDTLAAFKQLQAADSITPASLGTLIDSVADRVATAATADALTALRTDTATGLSIKADQTYVSEQLDTKASQADFDKVAHLKNAPAIYRLWEAHNDDTVSLNYNARKKADADGSIIDAGGVTLPSATPYTSTPDGPTGGSAGVMTAQQATELETHKQRLDALTPVVLTQAEYDALVEAGTVGPNQHYAIVEDAEA